ncbi:hypothetical protein SAMN05421770_103500 [Granulicella rosea]|uniref:Uncharacterized protein n=2 Tax=Granulicella rosea TaxID=474952 RepID=A0A239J9C0_9BACT|nr:hypothetical protein SAMN05421770_103500 [Granulicella rosea]
MAAFENPTGFETDAILPKFMEETGMRLLTAAEASYRVAYDKAREILDCRKDPLLELPFLEKIWIESDYPVELSALGMLNEQAYIEGFSDNIRRVARDELILFVREFEASHNL